METPSPKSDRDLKGDRVRLAGSAPRLPFRERRHRARQAARARIAARTARNLSAEQRANDPLARGRLGPGARLLRAVGALAGSTVVHAAVVGLGLVLAGFQVGVRAPQRQSVDIQVREHVPPPPPPPPPEEKPPEPEPVAKKPARPPPAARPEPPPPDPTPSPPPRVVGLSMESTTEGGGGPAFAVGNTRAGETAERALDPAAVPAQPPPEAAPGPNQVARRIPTAGVAYTQPRRKQPSAPPFPETLKAQGLEADVTVMVRLSAAGKVEEVKIIKASLYPEFNEAARAHALTEAYEPATRDGVPIAYSLSFTYRFRLQEE
jgi:periplasmic protein TonB